MSFNPEPSKQAVEILFSQKKIKPAHPPLFFHGLIVNKVNHHKHLGLIIDSKLTFSNRIIEQINKSRKLLGILKLLSSYLPLHSLNQIYKMYIRPRLDYCDVIYHILPLSNGYFSSVTLHTLMESIERIQYQAALLITGTWKGTSKNKLYNELGWESLTDRRWCRRLIHFYKIHNGLTPSYLRDNLPPKRRLLYGNDNSNVYHQVSCNTFRYKNSFYPDAIKTLGQNCHSCPSHASFKKGILALIQPNPKQTFNINDRQGMKSIFQLRFGLSLLRSHKKIHNFTDTPSDWCECKSAPENINHYLFHCNLFQVPRLKLINSVAVIVSSYNLIDEIHNVEIYLYGHRSLTR